MDFSSLLRYWPFLAQAWLVTIALTGLSILFGTLIALPVALARTYGGRLINGVLSVYVDSMRAIPLLVILVWTYFALPLTVGRALPPFTAAVIGLSAHLGAYMAEAIRSGLTSVRQGQMRAALALGMSRFGAIRTIILPQAVIRMLPPIGSVLVFAVKDSALASVIAVPEIIRQSQVLSGLTYRSFEVYTVAMGIYFVMCYPLARGVDRIYRRVAHLGAS
jgi:His/Glu/Gln/Arg/opine family amino acid ABC transporter permease subunit